MATEEEIVCTICGAKNESSVSRCESCGAQLDPLGSRELSPEEAAARETQQGRFRWKWVFVAVGIYATLQAIALIALPMVIDAYDPQGLAGLMISAAIWFVGGIIVGAISPGRTFVEPTVAALIVVVPTLLWIDFRSDVYKLSLMAMSVSGMLGVMVTLMGSFFGEKIQMRRHRG